MIEKLCQGFASCTFGLVLQGQVVNRWCFAFEERNLKILQQSLLTYLTQIRSIIQVPRFKNPSIPIYTSPVTPRPVDHLALAYQDSTAEFAFHGWSLVLRGHEDGVNAVAISPDNHWLVTGSSDHTARLSISQDNHWLVTGSADKTARLWLLQMGDLINLARITVARNFTTEEWKLYFPGEPYHKTFPDLPRPEMRTLRSELEMIASVAAPVTKKPAPAPRAIYPIAALSFREAKTMPEAPHQYTTKRFRSKSS